MKPSTALHQHRQAIRELVTRCRAANPRVFGPVVVGDDADGSDLDLLVDALPGATLFDLGALQVESETLLGFPVDVVTPGDLDQGWGSPRRLPCGSDVGRDVMLPSRLTSLPQDSVCVSQSK